MELKRIFEIFDYKISEGSVYCWNCYGPNARFIDFENEHATASIIIDNTNQFVYEAGIFPKDINKPVYRYIESGFVEAHKKEAEAKGVNHKEAFDNKNYTDLEVVEDFYDKANAIWNNLEYDTRIQVPIDTDLFYDLAVVAHNRDVTINSLVETILLEVIKRGEQLENN